MLIDVMERDCQAAIEAGSLRLYDDPLDADSERDEMVVTTRRGLVRLALVATETASRFEREHADVDPMAWMVVPRRMFGGRAAIDACLHRDECLRAVLLHGLSMGMDAEPKELDLLTGDEEHDFAECDDVICGAAEAPVEIERLRGRPRLWTSFLVGRSETGTVQGFDAVIAVDRIDAEARLLARHGGELAANIEIVEGFDPSLPLVEALVSPALADMLEQVARDPGSPLAEGLSVSVQQRFFA